MSEGERVAIPFGGTPIQVASPFPSKEALERAQLEKYRLDYLLRFGRIPFEDVRRGDNPPDFLVMREGSEGSLYGVDCAALTLQEKRTAEALFSKLVQKVAANDQASLQHLSGTDITIWFKHGIELPPRATDDSTVQDLIEALEQTEVDMDQAARINAEVSEQGFPEQLTQELKDGLGIVDNDRFGFQVAPVDSWQPRDPLSAQLGFNVVMSLPLMIQEGQHMRTEVQRLVSNHDRGRINQLLIIIGGPNREGISFPSEYVLVSWLREGPIEPVSAQHIEQVSVHSWISGEIFEIPVRAS